MRWPGEHDVARAQWALAGRLPPSLAPLARVAFNYRWAWMPAAREVFRSLDPHRWELCGENPIRLLQEVPLASLERAAADPGFVESAADIESALHAYLERTPEAEWSNPEHPVAFLCAEYGIHQSLPVYAGGLGVLAGDILKEASDRALPMVAVGLLYRQGYLHQQLDPTGWQFEYWLETDPARLPAALVMGPDGYPVTVTLAIRGREVTVQIWRVDVGRVPLYLLDTLHPDNDPLDRWVTGRLYVGDRGARLAQYVVLGIGGIRALQAMGIEPGVVHLNEGHAALAALELARQEVAEGRPVEEALAVARSRTVFTTHTPVAAGNETYDTGEIERALSPFDLDPEALLSLGRPPSRDGEEPFGVTTLGLYMSRHANAVSEPHQATARRMWHHLYPDRTLDEVPISHVTNGVHLPTWMSSRMRVLLDRHLGDGWGRRAADPETWAGVDDIPDRELWEARCALRADLVAFVKARSVHDRLVRGEPEEYVQAAARTFDPSVLTLGFARRAAAYKRFYLLVHDPVRALHLLEEPHPIQVALAAKAHPQDEEAKRILQRAFALKAHPQVAERVAFLEDYHLGIAEQLVWGCDVWLNVPRVPMEASGTSGMKAALNGGLNLSVLDGWWAEAFDGNNGWGISGDGSLDLSLQDDRDAEVLYDLLEREVIPLFHDRGDDGIPHGWVRRMKASLRSIGPRFNATRMLGDYVRTVYTPGS